MHRSIGDSTGTCWNDIIPFVRQQLMRGDPLILTPFYIIYIRLADRLSRFDKARWGGGIHSSLAFYAIQTYLALTNINWAHQRGQRGQTENRHVSAFVCTRSERVSERVSRSMSSKTKLVFSHRCLAEKTQGHSFEPHYRCNDPCHVTGAWVQWNIIGHYSQGRTARWSV